VDAEGAVSFATPLWLLLVVVALGLCAGLYAWRMRRAAAVAAFTARAGRDVAWLRRSVALLCAAACFAVAAAGPQWGRGFVQTPARGLDVVAVLDASRSMRARDVGPSRLERAWSELDALADARGPWRLGLVRFRGDAEVVSPLTEDHASVAALARETDPESVPGAGSGLARGVRAALDVFGTEGARRRVVLVLSDGEAQEDDDLASVTAAVRARGVVVLGVVIGTTAGATVPSDDTPDAAPLRDAQGEVVTSRARRQALDALASGTNGRVVELAADAFAMQRLIDDELRSRMPTADGFAREWRSIDRSAGFVALGLLLATPWWAALARMALVRGALRWMRSRRWRLGRSFPGRRGLRAAAGIALLSCVPWLLSATDPDELARRADAAFARNAPGDAVEPLTALAALRPDDVRVAFDLGLAQLRSGAWPAACASFERAAHSTNAVERAAARHGLALALAKQARSEEARGGERLAVAQDLLVHARSALVAGLADGADDAMRSNLDVVSYWLERVRAQREAAAPSGAGSAPGATNPPDTDSSATANDGAGGTRGDGAGTPAAGSGAAAGRDEASAAAPGAVDETGSSPRLPGGMFRAEAESIADVVRRFERERRAFDRASAAANARGGNDW
jgi:Ca-activated chloride channel family protein